MSFPIFQTFTKIALLLLWHVLRIVMSCFILILLYVANDTKHKFCKLQLYTEMALSLYSVLDYKATFKS